MYEWEKKVEFTGLKCNGCGSSNVTFDSKRRVLICNQCGKEEYYSRATLNASGKVLLSKDNAINFFAEGKFENAQHYALEVLNISQDNAPALFIMSYYDEIVMRKSGAISRFFDTVNDIALEGSEVEELQKLFIAAAYNMTDYEESIIKLMALNMQSEEDAQQLCGFIDKLCPYILMKRPSINFFTPSLCEMYGDLAEHCDIPKTCFALIKLIKQNPDSPYSDNSFYLQARSRYFYDNFILLVGGIIKKMKSQDLREKFISSYEKIKREYETDAKI